MKRFSTLRAKRASFVFVKQQKTVVRAFLMAASLLLSSTGSSMAVDVLPTGGSVVSGAGSISQTSSQMTINQTSDKLAIDWQSFSVGLGNAVTFNQPSSSSVAMNRVLGADVSVIQGQITANGKIYLINPNGILFSPSAQVNTGGLVASTLSMSIDDFMAGKTTFAGASTNAVVNEGNLVVSSGGTIALIAAKIINTGAITAPSGNVLLGAGAKVTLDLGGPVKIEVEEGALDALIEQGGAIRANGGIVYLTAKATNALVTTVINHTGITEAQTLATGEKGEIYLLGDDDQINVAGTLDASAPNGGNGGFIETSAKNVKIADDVTVTAAAASGESGTWLVDPTNITIAAASCTGTNCLSANTIQSTLNAGTNVAIATDAAGAQDGDITVNAPISWNKSSLTLSAADDIVINSTLTATSNATLSFLYGQSSASGTGGTYTVASNAQINIPLASAFTWRKGSSGTPKNLVFDNSLLRFGNGTEASITTYGTLKQPFYYNSAWYKLSYSTYPLDIQVGVSGDGTNNWNTNGTVVTTGSDYSGTGGSYASAVVSGSHNIEISKYLEGVGTITDSVVLSIAGNSIKVSNAYTLASGAAYLRTVTTLSNLSSSSALSNLRVWVGTRDDFIAGYDINYKVRGNITADGFVAITDATTQAKAVEIIQPNDTYTGPSSTGAVVFFYSTSDGAETSISPSCNFSSVATTNPDSSLISSVSDGSYVLFMHMADLAANSSGSMTWYYAATSAVLLADVVSQVSTDAATPPSAPSTPSAPVTTTTQTMAAIQSAQQTTISGAEMSGVTGPTAPHTLVTTAPHTLGSITASSPVSAPLVVGVETMGGLQLISINEGAGSSGAASGAPSSGEDSDQNNGTSEPQTMLASLSDSLASSGFLNVFVVNGGINTPSADDNNGQ